MIRILLPLLCLVSIARAQETDRQYLTGHFDPAVDPGFVQLGEEYSEGTAVGAYLRKETYAAFVRMASAAETIGIRLRIISATRNFESQKRIWENKWTGKVKVEGKDLSIIKSREERARLIMLYSSMPGTSRHHWGTDIDLNSLENQYFLKGEGLKVYKWLQEHGAEYGFCQPYTDKSTGRTGYEQEKWHWSYLPLSGPFLKNYQSIILYSDITGFEGSDIAVKVRAIDDYVSGVGCR